MKKLIPALLALILVLALAGCQEYNPLLGTWKADEIVITFTKDEMVVNAGNVENSGPCTYEKRSDKVWAVSTEGKVFVFEVVNKDLLRGDVGQGVSEFSYIIY